MLPSYIKDTTDFINKLGSLKYVDANGLLVTYSQVKKIHWVPETGIAMV